MRVRGIDLHAIFLSVFVLLLGVLVGLGFSGAQQAQTQSAVALKLATPPVTVHATQLGKVTATAVEIEFQATRHRNCRLTALSEWERPSGVRLTRANANKATLRPGQTRWIGLEVTIPPGLDPGPYRVRSVGEYACPDGQVFIVPTGWVEVILP